MFGVSLPELIVVCVIILIVVGPDKLPDAARKLGQILGNLKRNSDGIRREFYNAVYTPAKEITSEVKRELRSVTAIPDTPKTPELNTENTKDIPK